MTSKRNLADYIECFLHGGEGTDMCASCKYGFIANESDGSIYAVCRQKSLLQDVLAELRASPSADDVIFGLKCKGHIEVMNCDVCPYAQYSPYCERYINEDAIRLMNKRDEIIESYRTSNITPKFEKYNPCVDCPTNPANGGTGICNCTLGTPKITC